MIDIKKLLDQPDVFEKAAKLKGVSVDINFIIEGKTKQNQLQKECDDLRHEVNAASKNKPDAETIQKLKSTKEQIKKLEDTIRDIDEKIMQELCKIPNPPFADVPIGKDDSENVVLRKWGKIPEFDFELKDHVELGEELNMIDIERAAKVTGSRFYYLKGAAVWIQFALLQYAYRILTDKEEIEKIAGSVEKGHSTNVFEPVLPPVMIRPEMYTKMARLSDADKDEKYHLAQDDMYLIGSAEHTLGPMHADEVLDEKDLPIRYVGFSTAFRREAGSYGKDVRGILRVHQFDKIEMESFTVPEDSLKEQEFFVKIQERLLQGLEIPYQIVAVCTGDMGKPDAQQIDVECWMPAQKKYRETHSADLMTDYQSRRLNTRVRRKNGEFEFVHINDATVFAIGRTLIAIMENYQKKDGSIEIPKVLQPFMPLKKIIVKN